MDKFDLYDKLEAAHKSAAQTANQLAAAMEDMKPNPLMVILRHLAPRCWKIEIDCDDEPVRSPVLRDNYPSPFDMAEAAYAERDACEYMQFTFYFEGKDSRKYTPEGMLLYVGCNDEDERIGDYSGAGPVAETIDAVLEEYADED